MSTADVSTENFNRLRRAGDDAYVFLLFLDLFGGRDDQPTLR